MICMTENPSKQKSSKNESWFLLDCFGSRNDFQARFSSLNSHRKSNLSCWRRWVAKNWSLGIGKWIRIFNFCDEIPNEWMEKLSVFICHWSWIKLNVVSTFSNICPHFQAIKLDMLHHHMHYHMQHTVCSKMRLTMNSWHSINYWTMNRLLKINVATWNQLNWIYHILKYAFIELLMVIYWCIPIYKIELAKFCIKL